MNNVLEIPIEAITALSPERAVVVLRSVLRAECGYAKLKPTALTISGRLTVADGGIDAEVNAASAPEIPEDCLFENGLTGFQIKSGTSFKPWTQGAIRRELLDQGKNLHSEVARLMRCGGRYTLLCTGHDLTPEQRNKARACISSVLMQSGFTTPNNLVEVFGASQIAEFAERYPGTASLLTVDPIQEALVFDEWQRDAHMTNAFEASPEQSKIIIEIKTQLQGDTKHIRILGEPGLGKTRIVLESVRDTSLAPYVLYVQHGALFGQTKLFRQLLKDTYKRPLVLVIDELSESELADIWRHLKPRCGRLKIVSMDHGIDDTSDEEIVRLHAPRLPDDTIKEILSKVIGESRELDRWVAICEGSPRVALAVADNLRANPKDLLKPPSTVPVWKRFLHGYGGSDEGTARQVDCVTQHLSLFSRFGYEHPVGNEAEYISKLIQTVDPTIGWARFQEIIESLRRRRVLQGSRTLFFVPKALHIYLWQQFWKSYGRGFDCTQTFSEMPESLHVWFMRMFKFAGDANTAHVIENILNPRGLFSERKAITSAKGSRFLSTLAEANPAAVLALLEYTIGTWTDQELVEFEQDRQNIVWALEKIAVWPELTTRSIQLLTRFAVNENAEYSNNSTGTLTGLFRIGPEAAATESTPEDRLPAMLKLLRASSDAERRLGLNAMRSALETRHTGFRIVGPEYQGLRARAKLWIPKTYGEWWDAKFIYFKALTDETLTWSTTLRSEVCIALLDAVEQLITIPTCTELAFEVLNSLVNDSAMSPRKVNRFFWHWQKYQNDEKHPDIASKLRRIERHYTRNDLASRIQRYVIDVDWVEWHEAFDTQRNHPRNKAKALVKALASRLGRNPKSFTHVQHLLVPSNSAPGLTYFGEQLSLNDNLRTLLPAIIQLTIDKKHDGLLTGYLSAMQVSAFESYLSTVKEFLASEATAWLGASIAFRFDYDDKLFSQCLEALAKKWIEPGTFVALRFGNSLESIPHEKVKTLLQLLDEHSSNEALFTLVELLDSIPFNESSPFTSEFVLGIVSRSVPSDETRNVMRGHYWKNVCVKLTKWDASKSPFLLDVLLKAMGEDFHLTFDNDVEPLATSLVNADPAEAWDIVKRHFEGALPEWRSDLLNWLKGRFGFEENDTCSPIGALPVAKIIEWIEIEPETHAEIIAHAAAGTLDDEFGGQLTRELLKRYGQFDGVESGINATFHSGGWSGLTSSYLKRKREKLRQWLSAGFEPEITAWVESQIQYLDQRIVHEEIDEERSELD